MTNTRIVRPLLRLEPSPPVEWTEPLTSLSHQRHWIPPLRFLSGLLDGQIRVCSGIWVYGLRLLFPHQSLQPHTSRYTPLDLASLSLLTLCSRVCILDIATEVPQFACLLVVASGSGIQPKINFRFIDPSCNMHQRLIRSDSWPSALTRQPGCEYNAGVVWYKWKQR